MCMCLCVYMQLMMKSNPDSELTTEHLKSHLQKYRINYERSRREFHKLCDRDVKRDRKRRHLEQHHLTSDKASSATGSDFEPGANGNTSGRAMEEEDQQLRPFVYPCELAESAAATAACCYPTSYSDAPITVPVLSRMPELTDTQWRTFSMLMSTPPLGFDGGVDALSIHVPQETPSSFSSQTEFKRNCSRRCTRQCKRK